MSKRQYKNPKGLKKENLRNNMSDMELILNVLAFLEALKEQLQTCKGS